MIANSFIILPGISRKREENLWKEGIMDWDFFLGAKQIKGIPKLKKPYFDRQIMHAKKAMYLHQTDYFLDKLPSTETWRIYDLFKEDTVFLDIETDGVGKQADITVVGLFDGIDTKTMIKGINLDYYKLKEELLKYKLIVTFNGSSFDLPFIQKRHDILPNIPHIDLRHCCAKIGLFGGLKKIESMLSIKRSRVVEKFAGGDALTLWRMYKAGGDEYYLNLLVEYNCEDVINLKKIMNHCYGQLASDMKSRIIGKMMPIKYVDIGEADGYIK